MGQLTKEEQLYEDRKIYSEAKPELIKQYNAEIIEEEGFLDYAYYMNPITTAPARDEIKKAKDMLAFFDHFILPRELVKMRNKLKRIRIRLYNVRRLSLKSCLTLPALCIIFLLLGYYQNPDFYNAAVLVCIYITVISLGFVCLFENRFARESRGKKFIANERRDSIAEALVNMLSSDEAQTVNIQKAAARVRNARKESIFAFL